MTGVARTHVLARRNKLISICITFVRFANKAIATFLTYGLFICDKSTATLFLLKFFIKACQRIKSIGISFILIFSFSPPKSTINQFLGALVKKSPLHNSRAFAQQRHTITMQQKNNMPPMYQGTHLRHTSTRYPNSFDKFGNSQIGHVRIADIPSRLRDKHLQIWGGINVNLDFLTTPLADSVRIAEILYDLKTHLHAQTGASETTKANLHHAFVRLTQIWKRFEAVLDSWARKKA